MSVTAIREWIEKARPHAWAIWSGHPSLDAIEAALDLHEPRSGYGTTVCTACSCDEDDPYGNTFMEYPCPTVRAIETKLI